MKFSITTLFTALIFYAQLLTAQTPCENGKAGSYDCNQIDLMSHITLSEFSTSSANDIWGWTNPENGKEIAIIGLRNKTAFVDISDAVNPIILGYLSQPSSANSGGSTWRDVKVYQNHAFVVSDANASHGMQVFDLMKLDEYNGTPINFQQDAHYTGVQSAHNVVINENTGYAYIVGARGSHTCNAGGLHIVDVSDPKNPTYAGCFDSDGYTHDAQCVVYDGPDSRYQGLEICFNANENTVTIANVENKSATQLISKIGYPQSAYTHQGWLTPDHQFLLVNDELDEQSFGFNTRTLIWDVRDLENPKLIGEHYSNSKAIDHNLYNHGDLNYQANYLSGLRIYSTERIGDGQIREMAFFDTHPNADAAQFNGLWSVYPYFESGNVIVSDISKGLFVLRPTIQNLISAHPESKLICDLFGNEGISVEAMEENVSYQWQLVTPTGPVDLTDSDGFEGTTSNELIFRSAREAIQDDVFRCKITNSAGIINYSYAPQLTAGYPIPKFEIVNNGEGVHFINLSENASQYEWDFGDGSANSSEIEPIHFYEENGNYSITLSAFNECGGASYTIEVFIDILSSVGQEELKIQLYPNPAQDVIHLMTKKPERINNIQLLDMKGRSIISVNQFTNQLSLRNIQSGIYILVVETKDNEVIKHKIIKQ